MATVSDPDSKPTAPSARGKTTDRRSAHQEPSAEAVAAEAAAIYRDTFDTSPTPEEIAAEAYAIYQSRGEEHGRDQDDWLEAERRLRERGKPE